MITIIGAFILLLCLVSSILFIMRVIQFVDSNDDKIKYGYHIVITISLLWSLFYWYSHYFNY